MYQKNVEKYDSEQSYDCFLSGIKSHVEYAIFQIFEISWPVEYSTKQKKSQKTDFTADYWLFFNQNARAI